MITHGGEVVLRGNSSSFTVAARAKTYFQVTKPRIWWMLVFTAIGSMFAAAKGLPDIRMLALGAFAVTFGTAGAETISNYTDRDLDAVMTRTKGRPIPSEKIRPASKVAVFGSVLLSIGLVSSLAINVYAFALLAMGAADYLLIYSKWSKRKTPLNIILGSFAGGAPVLIGYVTISNTLNLEAIILASLVIVWIPSHVWSLALRYKDDYLKAKVPMLPVVTSEKNAIRCIACTGMLLVVFSALIYLVAGGEYGIVYLAVVSVTGAALTYLSIRLALKPSQENAWRLFKFTSPHLALIFGAIILQSLI
jgi:protoheme IX farnesyltransferase